MGKYYLHRKIELEENPDLVSEKAALKEHDMLSWSEDWDMFLFYKDSNGSISYINCDGGEPEDQTFGRNWGWVVHELNRAESRNPSA